MCLLQARSADGEVLSVGVVEGYKRIKGLDSTNALSEKAIELHTFVVEESARVLGPDAEDTVRWKE